MEHLTPCGIPGIGVLPWGTHLCHFYSDRQELVDSLVPYFKAGLINRERCLWITADPFPASEARVELGKVLPNLEGFIRDGALVIKDFGDWYTEGGGAKGEAVVAQWLREEESALAHGFSGLRITGNTSFLRPEDWSAFMDYERAATRAFGTRRIVALCSYSLLKSPGKAVFDVVQAHPFTIARRDRDWEVVEHVHRHFPEDGLR
jgi:hypothetical protein